MLIYVSNFFHLPTPLFLFYVLILPAVNSLAIAQQGYRIQDFSEDFYVEGISLDTTSYRTDFYWEIFSKASGKKLFQTGDKTLMEKFTSRYTTNLHEISKNNIRLPLSIQEDFNFDGYPDLVAFDDHQSEEGCYHDGGTVYLWDNHSWTKNEELSEFYSEAYCYRSGYLTVDPVTQTLITRNKYSYREAIDEEYVWENKKLKKVKTVLYSLDEYTFYKIDEKRLTGSGWKEYTYRSLEENAENYTACLSFEVENGKGRVVLFIYKNSLYYSFLNPESQVDFSYPAGENKVIQQKFTLQQGPQLHSLSFSSGSVTYTICESDTNSGIRIQLKGKDYFWKAKKQSWKGSLKNLKRGDAENLVLMASSQK
ncbi:hypothetical protein O2K51_04660 [Apibacter raozihei]|uniref:XAC2610-related protein n=1 Tax=Apibacter raozihei TaxID=2500547 RepID=UPI000FE3928D